MGYGAARGHRGGAHPSRSPGRRARRRRRARDDDGRARDRGPRARSRRRGRLRQRALRHDPDVAGAPRDAARASPPSSGPIDFAAIARALRRPWRRGSSATPSSSRRSGRRSPRTARRSSRWPSTARWVSVDQPPSVTRATFHLVPRRRLGRRRSRAALRGGLARHGGLHPLHRRRRGADRDRGPPFRRRSARRTSS